MSILGILGTVGGIGGLGVAAFLIGPQKILTFVMENWKVVLLGAVVLAGFLYVRHLQGEANDARKDSARWQGLFRQEKAAFAVEKVSLDGARAEINDNNRRIEAAAAELQRAKQQAAADQARADERYRATAGAVAGLERSAKAKGLAPCKVSQEAAHALDGL